MRKVLYHIKKQIFSRCILLLCFLFRIFLDASGQEAAIFDSLHKKTDTTINSKAKKLILASVQAGLWTGSLIALEKTWYSKYERSSFQTFNDWNECQQMDKFGHFYSAYQITEHTSNIWRWAGTDKKKSFIIGGISSLIFLNTIELMDAYSAKWGFSNSDLAGNLAGTGLYLSQAFAWDEQRIRLKFSYFPRQYGLLSSRSDQLFGSTLIEKALKDYNGQTYWASINLKSFFKVDKLPPWLCLSIGYGADNMLGGFENKWITESGVEVNHEDIKRNRKFLLSLDIDLSKVKSKNSVVRTIFSLVNTLKIPAPALAFNSQGRPRLYPIYF